MAMNYIRTPFGTAGDRTAIPNDVQPDGSVSQTEGFGIDYQLDPGSDPSALNVPRDKFNELIYDTQIAVQQTQQDGFPEHITAAMNGGVAYAYRQNATCRATDGNNYYSLINGNTDVPPTVNWGLVVYGGQFTTGDMLPWAFSTIRTGGWVWLNGTTIGNASSGATGRANADTATLFAMLWADYSNTVLPIQTSAGAASTRGISAAADFAANKRLPMPDYRGRSMFGQDNMGGASAANRVTTALSGISGVTLGASGGSETVQLTSNQNGAHTHTASTSSAGTHTHTGTTDTAGAHQHTYPTSSLGGSITSVSGGVQNGESPRTGTTNSAGTHSHSLTTDTAGAHTHTVTVDSAGLGSDHQNMPPAIIAAGWIMKL